MLNKPSINKLETRIVFLIIITTLLLVSKAVIADCSPGCGYSKAHDATTTWILNLCEHQGQCGERVYDTTVGFCDSYSYDPTSTQQCCQNHGLVGSTWYPGNCNGNQCTPSTTGTPESPKVEDWITTGPCTSGG
jgi:hypothetical protein